MQIITKGICFFTEQRIIIGQSHKSVKYTVNTVAVRVKI